MKYSLDFKQLVFPFDYTIFFMQYSRAYILEPWLLFSLPWTGTDDPDVSYQQGSKPHRHLSAIGNSKQILNAHDIEVPDFKVQWIRHIFNTR